MPASVSVIIPAWNLWSMTCDCLNSLAQHTEPGSAEIIVVDNGSTDETTSALQETGENLFGTAFKAVRLEKNLGFAKGCNAGARAASGDMLFFLNNDTLVTENWLPPLRGALEGSPFLGMVGPLLLYPGSGEVQHCGVGFVPTREVTHIYELFPGQHPLSRKGRLLQALTGAALLLPTQLFHACGGFHEGYVNGFEDLDLCCAVRRQGLHLTCVPKSVIYHLTSQTPGRFDHDTPNARLLNERWPLGFIPDMHRIALEDGLTPVLSPSLTLYLTLPQEKEHALTTAFTQNFDADRCRARLKAEPLWQGGYTLLARHQEQAGQWSDACETRARLIHFFPLAEHAAALARTAARSGDANIAEFALRAAQELLQRTENVAGTAPKAQAFARWSEKHGDPDLTELFRAWLSTYAQ